MLFAGLGLLLVAMGIPLARRNVPPNHWYGLRVPATFADKEVWYAANETTGRDLVRLGLIVTTLAVFLPGLVVLPDAEYTGILGGVLGFGALVLTVRGWRLANRLLKERQGR